MITAIILISCSVRRLHRCVRSEIVPLSGLLISLVHECLRSHGHVPFYSVYHRRHPSYFPTRPMPPSVREAVISQIRCKVFPQILGICSDFPAHLPPLPPASASRISLLERLNIGPPPFSVSPHFPSPPGLRCMALCCSLHTLQSNSSIAHYTLLVLASTPEAYV